MLEWVFRIGVAILLFLLILRVGSSMLRSAASGGGLETDIEPEDVENLDVYFVCVECGTEFKVTQLGKVQVPRHCAEPMKVVRRPRGAPPEAVAD
jgi:hypothetical protein